MDNFAFQWLQIRNLRAFSPDRDRFPGFDEPLRQAMFRETELFFAEIIREDRSILDLLDADFTYLNERLARHYGIPGVVGDEFRRVRLTGPPARRPADPGERPDGDLQPEPYLAGEAGPVGARAIARRAAAAAAARRLAAEGRSRRRGHGLDAAADGAAPRQASCAVCHKRLDPLGFGLENYDGVGAWRDKDGGQAVDASGTLPSGESFRGPGELKAILKSRPREFARCLTEKMLTYALGRGLEESDRCAVDRIVKDLEANEYRFSMLVAGSS